MNVPKAKTAPERAGGGKWKFSDLLADAEIRERWEKVRRYFFLRESTYDMTNRCNIRCEGCYYYEGEKQFARENGDPELWRRLMRDEKGRGITYVVLAGAEPSLVPDLLAVCFEEMPLGCIATNGFRRIPDSVGYKIHISVWGSDETSLRVRRARDLLLRQIENYRSDPRAVFVYTFTKSNIEEARGVVETLAGRDCRTTFNVFSAPVGYDGPLRHDGDSLARTRAVMMEMTAAFPDHVLFSPGNVAAHTHRLGLHDLYRCSYPRMNPSTDIGLGRSFRQYRADLSWDRSAACCVPDTDCADCRHYAAGSAIVTARLYRHAADPGTFRSWLDYVDTYLAVWVTGYEKGRNLCGRVIDPEGLAGEAPAGMDRIGRPAHNNLQERRNAVMNTVSSLLDGEWYERYKRISRLNIRSSIYDVTNQCNLRCRGCFFFSSGEHQAAPEEQDIHKWEAFVDAEKARGVNLAILIGGEPTLHLDRVAAFYDRLPSYCATNGLIKIPRDRFPDMMVGISLWGDEEDEKVLRGRNTFAVSSRNYAGDPCTYYLYTITPRQVGRTEAIIRRIADAGLKVHLQLLSNDEGVEGFSWTPGLLKDIRAEMDGMLDRYPDTVISSRYYHEIITTGRMLDRPFGWDECPSVTEPMDHRKPQPKRLIRFIRWAADLQTMHRCCTSATRDCSICKDGAAHMSWVMVNKRAHLRSAQDLRNWIEVYEMFAKLYRFIPW